MPVEIYPSAAKIKRNGVYQNLPAFVAETDDNAAQQMIATAESSNVAQYKHEVGEYFRLNDVLYETTNTINVGDNIVVGTNCKVAVLADNVSALEKDNYLINESLTPLENEVFFTPYGENLIPTNPSEIQWIDRSKFAFKLEYVKNKIVGTLELLKDHSGGRNVGYSLASSGYDLLDMHGKKCRVTFHNFPESVFVLITGSNADKTASRTWTLYPTENSYEFNYSTFKSRTNEDYLFINGFYLGSASSISTGTSFYFEFEISDETDVALGWNVNSRINNVLPEKHYTFDDHLVKGINHRGYNTIAPENTLPAYRLSKQKGFSFVETDIAKTSDDVFVLLHDLTINRTARNSDGTEISTTIDISTITYEQALTYDFGIWKSNTYAGTKIPTFDEFMQLCRDLKLYPYIELKVLTVPLTQTDISNLHAIVCKYGMEQSVTWISNNYDLLNMVHNVDKSARLGMTSTSTSFDFTTLYNFKGPANEVFIDFNVSYLTNEFINLCIANKLPLEVYSPNTEQAMLDLNGYISGATSDLLNFEEVIHDANIGEENTGIIT